MITASDALKLRLLTRRPVRENHLVWPTDGDVWYVKLWLAETVSSVNAVVAEALSDLLSHLHGMDPTLFEPSEEAAALAERFRMSVTVSGTTAPA